MNELLPTTALDQEVPTSGAWILEKFDDQVTEAISTGDVNILFNAIKELREMAKATGLTLAKMLHTSKQYWDVFETGEVFEQAFFEPVGLHKHTVERYVRVWDMFETKQIPAKFTDRFKDKNIKDLIPVANAIHQGYDIKSKQWKRLANAHDYTTTQSIVNKEIKQAKPRKNALRGYVETDGTIVAFKGEKRAEAGWLDVESSDPIVVQLIARIKKNTGMLEA